jgi:hypothetical protein
MGGRTALWTAGAPNVIAVCALAPWVETDDPVNQVAGRTVLLAHGDRDRITDPAGSRWFAAQAGRVTPDVRFVVVRGDTHAMLWRWRRWNRLVNDFVAGVMAARRAADRRRLAAGSVASRPVQPDVALASPDVALASPDVSLVSPDVSLASPVAPSPGVPSPAAPSPGVPSPGVAPPPVVPPNPGPDPDASHPMSTTLDLQPAPSSSAPGHEPDARSNGRAYR